jgi:chromosome segregation ATPase
VKSKASKLQLQAEIADLTSQVAMLSMSLRSSEYKTQTELGRVQDRVQGLVRQVEQDFEAVMDNEEDVDALFVATQSLQAQQNTARQQLRDLEAALVLRRITR